MQRVDQALEVRREAAPGADRKRPGRASRPGRSSPGSAHAWAGVVHHQGTAPVRGLVALDIGYNERPLQRHFLGYVERCSAANATEQVLFCRELAAVLAQPLPMGLRHVDLREVLEDVSRQTGLTFRVPAADYARTKAPYFYSLAAGYQAMDSLARVFQISDFIWHQQGNGEVYAGSWADSYWGARARSCWKPNCSTATRANSPPL